ncbi:MAG TPA: Re/Si-specific NAD(P)(+) transhydrogenase subunit alpha [Gemmatimonadaceae bacterium]|nr:Re/Si-specific NAD(P)(+) transhydrogenase subunit alpha [Gemmatimonadaceae bacterium]
MQVAVLKESAARENRVALTPDTVARLVKSKVEVVVQRGAGDRAGFPDAAYTAVGARIADDAAATAGGSAVVLKVQPPTEGEVGLMDAGSALVSLLKPGQHLALAQRLAERKVDALALELVPRITRAQSMDVLSSQSTVAGYKAVLLGAAALGKFLPMLTTAAGNIQPARAFIIGAGVSGLQAIATARRLGAVVSAFDIRPAAREQIESLGAKAIGGEAVSTSAETAGGYARAQTEDERASTLRVIAGHIKDVDLVITTANIPGKPAPKLISAETLRTMREGSVIVDLAAETGGNCELTRPGETVRAGGVTIIGTLDLPSTVPYHASQMFAKNIFTLLQHMITKEGALTIDPNDEITGAMLVTHDGRVLR